MTNWMELRQLISKHFNLDEIRLLCFDLNIDFDSLNGPAKENKIAELLLLLRRNGRLSELGPLLMKQRPNINWQDYFENNQQEKLAAPLSKRQPFTIQTAVLGIFILIGIGVGVFLINQNQTNSEGGAQLEESQQESLAGSEEIVSQEEESLSNNDSSCINSYLESVAPDDQTSVELGTTVTFYVPEEDLQNEELLGPYIIKLTENGEPLGALDIIYLPIANDFKATALIDKECQEVTEYYNQFRSRGKTLENWDVLEMALPEGEIGIRIGWQGNRMSLRALYTADAP